MRGTPLERLMSKTKKTDTCWIFTGGLDSGGYGQIKVNGKDRRTHRVAYELLVGPIPEGLVIDHLCRVRNCVNPDHMEPIDQRSNVLRGTNPWAVHSRQTHCANGHEFNAENTRYDRNGRVCRPCARRRNREYMQRKRSLLKTKLQLDTEASKLG